MILKQIATAITIGVLTVATVPSFASAATTTEEVRESDIARQDHNTSNAPTNDWVLYTRDTGAGAFRVGPGTPPAGAGSLELKTTTGNDKAYLFNYDHVGTMLSSVNALSYSTYRSAGNLQQVTALNIQVDVNGSAPDGFTTLVFEPVYNTAQGSVVNDTWQSWDAYNGGNATWWSSNPIPSAPDRDTFVSWNTIKAANPDAVIVGGFGVNQGGGNAGLTASSDKLAIGAAENKVTYNFEGPKPPKATTKEQCKGEGYKNFEASYKNQGDCVSSVASNGKAKGNPTPVDSMVEFFRSMF